MNGIMGLSGTMRAPESSKVILEPSFGSVMCLNSIKLHLNSCRPRRGGII